MPGNVIISGVSVVTFTPFALTDLSHLCKTPCHVLVALLPRLQSFVNHPHDFSHKCVRPVFYWLYMSFK